MKRNYIFLCLFSLELLVVCYSHQQSPLSPPPPAPKFDYLMMAETWPATYCKVLSCRPDIPSKFTIHGMWPTKNTAPQPRDCDPTRPFILDEVRDLEPQLLVDWPNLESDLITNRYVTWANQWKLHGTCFGTSIKDYFELSLKAYKNKDLKSILEKANIKPDDENSIEKTKIVDAIYKDIGFYPQLDCTYLYKKLYLLEIRLCFKFVGESKVVQYENCRGKYTQKCYASDDIYIPIKGKESELVSDS